MLPTQGPKSQPALPSAAAPKALPAAPKAQAVAPKTAPPASDAVVLSPKAAIAPKLPPKVEVKAPESFLSRHKLALVLGAAVVGLPAAGFIAFIGTYVPPGIGLAATVGYSLGAGLLGGAVGSGLAAGLSWAKERLFGR
jgi:hypothetical protein